MSQEAILRLRLAKISERIRSVGVDALIITKNSNVKYLAGGSFSGGVILVLCKLGTADLIGSIVEFEGYEAPGEWLKLKVVKKGESFRDRVLESIIGVGGNYFEADDVESWLSDLIGKRTSSLLRRGNRFVEESRTIKDDAELAIIKESGKLTKLSFDAIEASLKAGVMEVELAARAEYAARSNGADGMAFQSIVASGWRSAFPHGLASRKKVKEGEMVVVDLGTVVQGYCFDMTRTFRVGKVDDRMQRLYEEVNEAYDRAIKSVKPGAKAQDIENVVADHFKVKGLDELYIHSVGHGVGLDVHEEPRLSRDSTYVLKEGNVLTIEPGLYIRGVGGVRYENTVQVTSEGAMVL